MFTLLVTRITFFFFIVFLFLAKQAFFFEEEFLVVVCFFTIFFLLVKLVSELVFFELNSRSLQVLGQFHALYIVKASIVSSVIRYYALRSSFLLVALRNLNLVMHWFGILVLKKVDLLHLYLQRNLANKLQKLVAIENSILKDDVCAFIPKGEYMGKEEFFSTYSGSLLDK